jgi:peptidoglycan-associated lipoprotein
MSAQYWVRSVGIALLVAVAVTGCKRPWFRKSRGPQPPVGSDTVLDTGAAQDAAIAGREGFEAGRPTVTPPQTFDTVLFDYDSAQIVEAERAKAEAVASYLKGNPTTGVILEGHCDERGSNEYNMSLGERRSLALRAYLLNLGIDNARIQTRSYGEERPKDPGHNEDAWRVNRRVEFVFLQ